MNAIAEEAVRLLKENGLHLATAESCTGGLIAKLITDVSGSSAVFECGIISYSNRIKAEVLGVSEETLRKYGAVSEETVKEMARGVLRLSGADIALAVSGIAGPTSDDTNKPVGLIWLAAATNEEVLTKKLTNSFTENIRESNRNSAAEEALKLASSLISQKRRRQES